ncbi:MAG: hypothetical protein ABSH19_06125, partial [Opitutales bacterium]
MQKRRRRTAKILGGAAAVLAVVAGCVAEKPPSIVYTPLPVASATPAAADASAMFWQALQGDHYQDLPAAITALENVQSTQPNDPHLNMLLGMAYAWLDFGQYSPGADGLKNDASYQTTLAQAGSLAVHYLTRARELAPDDRILPGFLATAQFLQARANHDQAAEDAAYQALLANTKAYPQFQGFVQGWVLTAMYPADSPRFADGMNGYYASLDSCVGFPVSRNDPSAPDFVFNILAKADPACYNTSTAPHNLQGTFLGLGDAFAKQGRLTQAREAYENVMRVPDHISWSYLHLVDGRLRKLDQLQKDFTTTSGQVRVAPGEPAMFFQAYYSC